MKLIFRLVSEFCTHCLLLLTLELHLEDVNDESLSFENMNKLVWADECIITIYNTPTSLLETLDLSSYKAALSQELLNTRVPCLYFLCCYYTRALRHLEAYNDHKKYQSVGSMPIYVPTVVSALSQHFEIASGSWQKVFLFAEVVAIFLNWC
jgi:hypothetical protein